MPYNFGQTAPVSSLLITPFSREALWTDTRPHAVGNTPGPLTMSGSNIALFKFKLQESYRVRKWFVGTQSASFNVDVGVWSEDGQTKIASMGSTAGASTGVYVSADFTLAPGAYWCGLAASNGTGQISGTSGSIIPGYGSQSTGVAMHVVATSIPVPSTISPGSYLLRYVYLYGISRDSGLV